MKNIISILLVALLFASCSKEELITPEQQVTYTVECDRCLVYVADANNPSVDSGNAKHYLVEGDFQYVFASEGLDTAILRVYVSVFQLGTDVHASIRTNDGREAEFTEYLGMTRDIRDYSIPTFEKTLKLYLK